MMFVRRGGLVRNFEPMIDVEEKGQNPTTKHIIKLYDNTFHNTVHQQSQKWGDLLEASVS